MTDLHLAILAKIDRCLAEMDTLAGRLGTSENRGERILLAQEIAWRSKQIKALQEVLMKQGDTEEL